MREVLVEKSKRGLWEKLYAIATYAVSPILSIIILFWLYRLWEVDVTIPFSYGGDALSVGTLIKGIIEGNSIFFNSRVGAPSGLNYLDMPSGDGLHLAIIWVMSFFAKNYGTVLNLYYLMTYPLTALISFIVLRKLGFSARLGILGSLLYAFLPYHMLRGVNHLFLSGYYVVPLASYIVLRCIDEKDIFFFGRKVQANGGDSAGTKNNKWIAKIIAVFLAGLLIGSSGVYYAFFACFLLAVAAAICLLSYRSFRKALIPMVLIISIILGAVINVLPNELYARKYGKNAEVSQRYPAEAELYGLKITQLLLPVTGHRIDYLSDKKAKYNEYAPLANENDSASLGILGSVGFVVTIGYFVFGNRKVKSLNSLGILNICSILLATIGGVSTLFAFFVTPMIRSYNRISVFIAFYSLVALLYCLQYLGQRLKDRKLMTFLFNAGLILMLIFGIFDQTSPKLLPKYGKIAEEFKNDGVFVSQIEAVMPMNAMIYQLPYLPYPESPPLHDMEDYAPFKAYLHSENLRWSYGVVRGREMDKWEKSLSKMPTDDFISEIVKKGYTGIYIDKKGYEASEIKALEMKIDSIIKEKPLVSKDNRYLFYNLQNYIKGNK